MNWVDIEAKYYMKTFARLPVVLVEGEGVRVRDVDGKSYLDMVGGIAVNILGHGHPSLVEAISSQAAKLIHTSNLYYTVPQLELAERLIENSCADRIFFGNSGAEANEGAIKLARKWGKVYREGAYEVISAEYSFHGRTLATVAATGQAKMKGPFEPMPIGFVHVPFNDLEAIKGATNGNTCAVLLEVIQGESGVHIGDQDYIAGVREWCDSENLLFILDEIQTGLGRTGKLFGYERYGVEPDVFTLAKGLAGGVPIGAFLSKEKASVLAASEHGSTFGGNPLACAAGVATFDAIVDEKLVENSAETGSYLLGKLNDLKQQNDRVTEVRGIGLMAAADLDDEVAGAVVSTALSKGLILNNTGPKTVRMVPPLIVSKAEVDEAVSILSDSLDEL